jgi:hypothetical protein
LEDNPNNYEARDKANKKTQAADLSGMYGDMKALDDQLGKPVWSKAGDGLLICILTDGSTMSDKGKNYTGTDLVEHMIATRKAKLLATFQRVHSEGQCFLMGWYKDCHEDAFGKPKVDEHPPVATKRRKLSLAVLGRKKRAA